MNISKDIASKLLLYSPDSGIFTWKVHRAGNAQKGSPAGFTAKDGYHRIKLLNHSYLSHILAWVMHYGEYPQEEIDHINGNRSDNRIINLRLCSRVENSRNTIIRKDNRSGAKGVGFHKPSGKWRARIHLNGKSVFLGNFDDIDSARKAYSDKAKEVYGEFYCDSDCRQDHEVFIWAGSQRKLA